MIRVHIGVLPTEEREQGSTLVENTADYPRAREQIYEALAAETSLDVFVLTRVCDDWFWDLVEYHGDVTQVTMPQLNVSNANCQSMPCRTTWQRNRS